MAFSLRFIKSMCFATSLLAISVEAVRAEVVVTTSDGAEISGEITGWSTTELILVTADTSRSISTKELLEVKRKATSIGELENSPMIELIDGSRFAISEFTLVDRTATVHAPLGKEPLAIPAEHVRLVQFLGEANRTQSWKREAVAGDILVIMKKDSAEMETLTGVINSVDPERVEFTWEGDRIPVKRAKIAGLVFYQSATQTAPEPTCWLTLSSGAKLAADRIDQEDSNLRVTTVTGFAVTIPFDEVARADYSVGKLSYISDIEPLVSKWTPLVELPASAESIRNHGVTRRNISVGGSPLTLLWPADGRLQTYDKGLAIRSRSELQYRLPKSMRRFIATAGIDPEMASQGNVQLVIEADGEVVFAETITGDQPPTQIDIDITGKQRLTIVVDYGENLDLGDVLNLVEARLVK